jgi:hypothetical protein
MQCRNTEDTELNADWMLRWQNVFFELEVSLYNIRLSSYTIVQHGAWRLSWLAGS